METLDYHFALFPLREESVAAKVSAPHSAKKFLSLGIEKGAPLLCSIVEGLRGSITSQIAVKMSIDAILHRALEVAADSSPSPLATEVVRQSFKQANTEVYQYGHRMGAGGKMGATGMVAVLAGDRLSMARVGRYEGYLWRDGSLVPLFEEVTNVVKEEHSPGVLSRFIGANSQILVDLANVKLKNSDSVVLTTLPGGESLKLLIQSVLPQPFSLGEKAAVLADETRDLADERNVVIALLSIGRATIHLREVVGE